MRLGAWLRRAWHRGEWEWLALAGILLAIIVVLVQVAAALNPDTASTQIFLTRDVSRPATVRLVLKTVSLPPFGVSSQSCDGVAFRHGFPDQALYLGVGWYVDIPARPTGQSYHCTFKNAFVTRTLDIPAAGDPGNSMSITDPVSHASLPRTAPIRFSLATTCDGFSSTPAGALIRDASGHSALVGEFGCGSKGGHGTFARPLGAGFVAGPGTLAVYTERMVYLTAPGWSCVSIIYDTATSVPIVWS